TTGHPPRRTLFPYTTLFRSDRLAGHPHEHEVLVEPAHDDVEYGVVPVVQSVHDQDGLLPHAVVRPHRVHERTLCVMLVDQPPLENRKSTRLNSSHDQISYAV